MILNNSPALYVGDKAVQRVYLGSELLWGSPPAGGSYADEVGADSPLIWYRMDETSGTLVANSGTGSSLDATHQAGVAIDQPGRVGRCITLSGATDSWTGGPSLPTSLRLPTNLGDSITLECWWRGTSPGTNAISGSVGSPHAFISASTSSSQKAWVWALFGSASGYGRPAVWIGNAYTRMVSPTSVNDGAWHHLVVVLTNTTAGTSWKADFYIDGVLDETVDPTATDSVPSHNPQIQVGRNGRATATPLAGGLDEVALYPHALSAARIAAHYAAAIA